MQMTGRIALPIVALAALLILAVSAPVFGDQSSAAGQPLIAADSTIQSAIADAGRATDKAAFESQARRIKVAAGDDVTRLVGQLLLYSALNAKDAGAKPLVGRILKLLNLPKETLVTALVPQLDNADALIVENTRALLSGYEDRSVTRGPDFSTYRAIIESDVLAGREPQASLIRFMYESDPGAALRTLVRAMQLRQPDEIKPILWAEHVVANLFWKRQYGFVKPTDTDAASIEQLEKLSHHLQWWVRLYVASIVKKNPELGNAQLKDCLAADANGLVRQALQTH